MAALHPRRLFLQVSHSHSLTSSRAWLKLLAHVTSSPRPLLMILFKITAHELPPSALVASLSCSSFFLHVTFQMTTYFFKHILSIVCGLCPVLNHKLHRDRGFVLLTDVSPRTQTV